MQVSLGPLDADEMNGWLRFARRVLCDLRTEPGDMDSLFAANLLGEWCAMVDSWNDVLIKGSSDILTSKVSTPRWTRSRKKIF